MVIVEFDPLFEKAARKIKDSAIKARIKKQIEKVVRHPGACKPMMYARKGTREVYVPPYRISYAWLEDEGKIVFLCLYHKDEQ